MAASGEVRLPAIRSTRPRLPGAPRVPSRGDRPRRHPAEALMTGHGLQLRLDRAYRGGPSSSSPQAGRWRQAGTSARRLVSRWPHRELNIAPPAPAFVHTRLAETPFHPGRARACLPRPAAVATRRPVDRQPHPRRQGRSGRRSRPPPSGPAAAHLLPLRRGGAGLPGAGAPFAFRAGDLVLQPPGLRHRVLAASEGFEVVELAFLPGTPLDRSRPGLPVSRGAPERVREGQRFLHPWANGALPQQLAPCHGAPPRTGFRDRRARHRPDAPVRWSGFGRAPGGGRSAVPLRARGHGGDRRRDESGTRSG